ncbi:hypothetical protein T265_11566 [Opisthorchis viverrini]|uniref:Uncharacterized protein n=1 Tax=Opisthorchis viverrini TaxID=6198 RepID=A0A074Z939_OPIVI|nr:hypothetical protein T265_11566 [Opisthorchis viverrini]KER19740.1 hypothetical protein T265_11566 [Opisthorchis viverrini]
MNTSCRATRGEREGRETVRLPKLRQEHGSNPGPSVSGAHAPKSVATRISEQTEHASASKAWLYTPLFRFPVIETVAAGTNVPMAHGL